MYFYILKIYILQQIIKYGPLKICRKYQISIKSKTCRKRQHVSKNITGARLVEGREILLHLYCMEKVSSVFEILPHYCDLVFQSNEEMTLVLIKPSQLWGLKFLRN